MIDKTERSWPEWLGPLCEEVTRELDRLDRSQDVQRPDLEREAADLQARLDGWAISLAKPDLSPCVREDIEERYARAKARLQTLRSDLSGLEGRQARHQGLVDPRQVLDRLQRLGDVLASGNVAQGNLELCRHIDRIDAYADGRVVMRTSKLGIFEGVATVLARPATSTPSTAVEAGAKRIRPRHRGHARVDQPLASGSSLLPEMGTTADPGRFADLDPKWFWEDELEIGGPTCWAAEHAAEVAGLRENGWTMARLAAHFGRSAPTIRHALKIAAERGPITPPAARGGTKPGTEPPG
jgi:hypothetical protein